MNINTKQNSFSQPVSRIFVRLTTNGKRKPQFTNENETEIKVSYIVPRKYKVQTSQDDQQKIRLLYVLTHPIIN